MTGRWRDMAEVTITGVRATTGIGRALQDAYDKVMRQVGLHCMREAKRNAPRSPTMKQLSKTLVRKKRTRQRTMPGGLEKSITSEVRTGADGEVSVSVFVPSNSLAGKYAEYIHDKKGVKWWKRGTGTVAKGARADDKFIERAVKDNEQAYGRKIMKATDDAIRAVFGTA